MNFMGKAKLKTCISSVKKMKNLSKFKKFDKQSLIGLQIKKQERIREINFKCYS